MFRAGYIKMMTSSFLWWAKPKQVKRVSKIDNASKASKDNEEGKIDFKQGEKDLRSEVETKT